MLRKIEIIVSVLILMAILGITILGLSGRSCSTDLIPVSDELNYQETVTSKLDNNHIKYDHYGFCEGGPWELFSNNEGEIYTFEWDTIMNVEYSISCIRTSWKDGVQTFQKIEEKAVRNAYESGEEVSYTSTDEEGRLFLNGWDGMFYALDSSGDLINKFNAVENRKKIATDTEFSSIGSHYVMGDYVYLIIYETDYKDDTFSLQKFNWKTGEYVSAFEIKSFIPEKFTNGIIYGYGEDSIIGIDIYGNETLYIEVPTDNKTSVTYNNMSYNKRSIAVFGNDIYYSDSEGIYFAENGDEKFQVFLDKNEVEVLNESYSIVDMAVNSMGEIYVLAIAGADEEWPTDLFIIKK